MPSFTTQLSNLQSIGPVVEIQFSVTTVLEENLRKNNQPIPSPVPVAAMIDTGASGTVIRQGIPAQLGLNPVGVVMINTPSSVNVQCYRYVARLLFPHNVIIQTFVIEAPLQNQHIQCLIGRDVLQHGVFIYTGYNNTFTLSF